MNCLLNSCDAETILKYGIQYTDYLSELVIFFRKLLGSLHFVRNLRDADLVLVPALGVSPITRKCCHRGSVGHNNIDGGHNNENVCPQLAQDQSNRQMMSWAQIVKAAE